VVSGLLGSVFSFGDDLKKRLRGLLHDPIGSASAEVGAFNDKAQSAARGLLSGQDRGGMQSVDALGAGPHALGGLLGAIKVYHGSPHVFDKADSSKIGTGEGAQAYGHGLYWAESPGVADSYRKALSDNVFSVGGADLPGPVAKYGQTGQSPERQALPMPQKMATYALDSAVRAGSDDPAKAAIAHLTKHGNGNADAKEAAAIIQQWAQQGSKVEAGSLYEANLRWPDAAREAKDPLGPQHFLDWDKPLGQQPQIAEKVRPLLGDAVDVLPYSGGWGDLEPNPQAMRELFTKGGTKLGMYSDAEAQALDLYGSAAIKALGKGDKESWKASEALRRAGIPGVMYHDAGSRAAGQGTRNYVTFDDALVELLTRNGLPIK
jgi:hypothetical protein